METLRNNHLSVFFSLSPLSLVRVCLFVKPATQSVNVRDKRQQLLRETPKKATRQKIQKSILLFYFSLLAAADAMMMSAQRRRRWRRPFLFFEFSLNIILYAFSYVLCVRIRLS